MSDTPDSTPPEQAPDPSSQRRSHRLRNTLLAIAGGVGVITVVGGVVFYIWGNRIVTALLLPRVTAAVDEAIDRPTELGDVEGLTFWGVRLGRSVIPPTETDQSSITVDEIEVKIGLRSLIFQQIAKSEVVLVRPNVSLVQAEDGSWTDFELPEADETESRIKSEIQSIKIEDARVTAVPFTDPDAAAIVPRQALQVQDTDVLIEFFGEGARELTFDAAGEIESGELETGTLETGRFELNGEGNLDTQAFKAAVQIDDIPVTGVNIFLPESLGLVSGALDGNLTLATALVEGGLDEDITDIRGVASLQNGELRTSQLAAPVEDIRSQLVFRGQSVTVEDTGLELDDVVLSASGDVDWTEGYDLSAQIPAISLAKMQALGGFDLPVVAEGAFGLEVQVTGELDQPQAQGRLASLSPVQIDRLGLQSATADFAVTRSQFDLNQLRLLPQVGGLVVASGQLDLSDLDDLTFDLEAAASDLPADTVAQIYDVQVPDNLTIGDLSADIQSSGSLDSPVATAQFQLSASDFPGTGELVLANNTLTLDNAQLQVSGGTLSAAAVLDLDTLIFELDAQATSIATDALAQTYGIAVPEDIVIGNLSADINAAGELRSPTAFARFQLSESDFPGTGEIAFDNNVLTLDNTQLQVADGTLNATALLDIDSRNFQADIATRRIPIQQFTNQAEGLLSADIAASGNLDALDADSIQVSGEAAIANAQVQLTATSEPLLERGDWTTAFALQGNTLAIDYFNAPGVYADGTIGLDLDRSNPIGDLNLSVALESVDLQPLNSFIPATASDYARVDGFASFEGQVLGTLFDPQVIGDARLNNFAVNELLFEPISGPVAFSLSEGGRVDLRGTEDRLQLALGGSSEEALLDRPLAFEVRNLGFVAEGSGENSQFQASVLQLPLELLDIRPAVQYGFGTVTGRLDANLEADLTNLDNPIVSGELAIADPTLSPVDADQLTASFTYANNTATVERGELLLDDSRYLLTGSAALPSTSRDDIAYEGVLTVAEGRIEDLVPVIEAIDFSAFGLAVPTEPLGSAADVATSPVGLPEGSFLEKLESFVAFLEENPPEEDEPGDLVLADLDQLTGEFTGAIEVAGRTSAPSELMADFDIQGSNWELGQYTEENNFSVSGEIQQGSVDIVADVNAQETQLDLTASGNLDQLDGRLVAENIPVELVELVYPLPAEVTGDLDTVTTFGGSLSNPAVASRLLVTEVQVNGYDIERIGATLDYRNALLTLESEIAVLPVGSRRVDGQTEVQREDQREGEAAIASVSPLLSGFGSNPITIEGSVPYAFSFMDVTPPTQQIALNAVVPGENFALVNAATDDRIRWEGGDGEIVVQIGGTMAQPLVAGEATLRDGVIVSELIGDPVTNIDGDVLFNLERVNIQQFQAQINNGRIVAEGTLPLLLSGQSILSSPAPVLTRPWQAAQIDPQLNPSLKQLQPASINGSDTDGILVSVEDLPIDYEDILQADFQGEILISDAVLAPTISGGLEVNNGAVQANQLLRRAGGSSLPTEDELEEINPYRAEYFDIDPLEIQAEEETAGFLDNIVVQDFALAFGDRLSIIGQPFYRITADGTLNINGTLNDLRPNGVIELRSGQINLFSTRFRLDRNAANTATFTPESGLDPFLDVVMLARAQETDITNTPVVAGGFLSADIEETPVETTGSVQYVRVRAEAIGPASEISDNLVLTSDPPRRQGELLALLGSDVFTDLSSASYLQVAEFVGGGSLATFGDRVADAVGLQSFRVFPTTDTGEDSTASIGIGIEATASIGERFNIDFLQVLNSSDRPQLGVQYEFTDNLRIRGASNLEIEDTDFELEYRIRF
ncbi:translocation/assembly module TamB domain-containing protein [cf. Phormidesmis sp. LEGE 11477]|uniref:translocation/assembly module TamB domain-containing protein n=1 Tax=cf. Phormidesmis sp. LEGE 11477 TaxID=1828680 RepID=UPI001880DFBB|nr:translocation/assembly module TamB domain-containing protein [cf. Phormidesmis sp. LEGE 11477]MBE9063446.1 translocation/assembly module TamB domain-containing protein [cf. Phormidesmis sp. LEGE 11477]